MNNDDMNLWAIILAAGKGSRLLQASGGVAKQFFTYCGEPLYWKSFIQFSSCSKVCGIVIVFPVDVKNSEEEAFTSLVKKYGFKIPHRVASGGVLRQHSVKNGLLHLPKECTHVLVHDAARPFVSLSLIDRVIHKLKSGISSVIPGIPVTDTIKYVNQEKVEYTPDREHLLSVQTPQGFQKLVLLESHIKAEKEHWVVTDDSSLLEKCGHSVHIVEGEIGNIKITYAEDLKMLSKEKSNIPIVGYGYDVHRYSTENKDGGTQAARVMKLGGVPIIEAPEVLAHSDGDVVIHALMDALLGCIGEGDIGQHFPDTDKSYEAINSSVLLDIVLDKVHKAHVKLIHIDITIIAQIPKVSPYRSAIRKNITSLLNMEHRHVNVKATTEERLGFTGECKGIKAVVVVTASQFLQ